jgi:hypothetical protein
VVLKKITEKLCYKIQKSVRSFWSSSINLTIIFRWSKYIGWWLVVDKRVQPFNIENRVLYKEISNKKCYLYWFVTYKICKFVGCRQAGNIVKGGFSFLFYSTYEKFYMCEDKFQLWIRSTASQFIYGENATGTKYIKVIRVKVLTVARRKIYDCMWKGV